MHETIWKPQAVGEAPPTCHPTVTRGQKCFSRSGRSRLFRKFCSSMATRLSEKWCGGFGSQTCPWSSLQTLFSAEKEAGGVAFKGASSFGVCHRSLDHPPGKGGDSETIWGNLSSQSSVAILDRIGMELPKADAEGQREGRGCHCSLEAVSLAPYKKSLNGWVPIWFFWMKAAVCLLLISAEPGPPEVRPLSCVSVTKGIKSLLFPLLRSAPNGDTWDSTGGFTLPTLKAIKWRLSLNSCCVIFQHLLCFCGMAAGLTRAVRSSVSWILIPGFILKSFRHMLLSLIQMSSSGHISNGKQLTLHLMTSQNWQVFWFVPYTDFVVLKNSYGHVSMPQIYPGGIKFVSITYA
jgi:hypothetical protein